MQETLLDIQPKFKSDLLSGVELFKESLREFVTHYREK